MKGEESEVRKRGVRSEKLQASKHSQLRSFGGGLGDATVPQRGFGGECPQGSDLVSLSIHMTNHPITDRERKDRDRQTNQLHPSRFVKIKNNNLPCHRNQ